MTSSALSGKRFLFVDDDATSIYYFVRELRQRNCLDVHIADSLDDALDLLYGTRYDFVLIDLYCAPESIRLSQYKSILGAIQFNQGQLLGLWLDDHQPTDKYAYISHLPSQLNPVTTLQQTKILLDKNQLTSKEFADKLETLV